jgi:hypothetical protein
VASRTHSPHVAVAVGLLLLPSLAAAEALRNADVALHVMVGAETQGDRGNPVAYGVGAELLWRMRVGGFASLLSSSGSPILPVKGAGDTTLPSLADRISVPFGFAARPLANLGGNGERWIEQLARGVDIQIGLTVEHYRTSGDADTVVGGHLALGVDVPITGGFAIRAMARLMVTPEITLQSAAEQKVHVGLANGQFYLGLAWYP